MRAIKKCEALQYAEGGLDKAWMQMRGIREIIVGIDM